MSRIRLSYFFNITSVKELAIIDNYDSFTYNLVHYFDALDCNVTVYRNDEINFNRINEFPRIVLSPGPGLPSDSGDTMKVIQRFYKQKSILGICLGMQCLGTFFGHRLENLNDVLHGKQSKVIVSDNSCIFKNLPKSFNVGHYHSWIIEKKVNSSLIATSRLSSGEIMSVRHKDLSIYGTQFHPESILTDHGKAILNNWLNLS